VKVRGKGVEREDVDAVPAGIAKPDESAVGNNCETLSVNTETQGRPVGHDGHAAVPHPPVKVCHTHRP